MKINILATIFILGLCVLMLAACGGERPIDIDAVMSQPKTYVSSDTCKMCHLEHYDSWKMTLHSRMLQNVQQNQDNIIVPIDEKTIREDLAKLGDLLKVPADQIYVPKVDEIKYTIGSHWSQRYLVEKSGDLYIAPIQYNAENHRWVNYHEEDWDQRSWLLNCGGCHATGVDLEKKTFIEPGVGCEACHGKGSWHAALPKTAVFEKRQTIVNPAKLTMGVAVQICGSCHGKGQATNDKGASWAMGYQPGRSLETYYRTPYFGDANVKQVYAEHFAKGHHQQYNDWQVSRHFIEGVTCTSCHYVHQLGLPATGSQTVGAGSQQCFECHTILNKTTGHAIHSFANCIGCHMPRIAESTESGKNHSHVGVVLLPKDSIDNPELPNSCTSCHKHKDANLKELQEKAFPGSMDDW
jgi:hypothetical protein